MSFNKIRLELARDHDFPDGSRERGYEFTAPLGQDGRISESDWKGNRARCRVRRFWSGGPDEVGHLIRKPGGPGRFITICLAILTTTKVGTASGIIALFPENTSRSRSMMMCCARLE